nr:helix-turn-helix domain-containing protein [Staphylococcus aureus]
MKLSSDINTDFEVTTLSYLQKLIIVMMNLNMKISKSEIARHMGVDRRTVDKYSNVFDLYFINSSIKITTLLNQ